jgi:flavin-binding protein dodecin
MSRRGGGCRRDRRGKEAASMSIAKITELTSTSERSFEEAIQEGIERASATLRGITGAWISDQEVVVEDGVITLYKVRMRVTFVLD